VLLLLLEALLLQLLLDPLQLLVLLQLQPQALVQVLEVAQVPALEVVLPQPRQEITLLTIALIMPIPLEKLIFLAQKDLVIVLEHGTTLVLLSGEVIAQNMPLALLVLLNHPLMSILQPTGVGAWMLAMSTFAL
jgi:hypothetical protein